MTKQLLQLQRAHKLWYHVVWIAGSSLSKTVASPNSMNKSFLDTIFHEAWVNSFEHWENNCFQTLLTNTSIFSKHLTASQKLGPNFQLQTLDTTITNLSVCCFCTKENYRILLHKQYRKFEAKAYSNTLDTIPSLPILVIQGIQKTIILMGKAG